MRRSVLLLGVLALAQVPLASALAAGKPQCKQNPDGGYSCPNPGFAIAADGSNQCTIELFSDSKGGEWKMSCTNQAASGDFSWTYDEAGAKGVKEVGHCVYYCGQNTHEYITDPNNPKQVLIYKHTVEEPKGPCGQMVLTGNKRTIHTFDKVANSGVEIVETYDKQTLQWTEQSRRTFTTLSTDPPGTKKDAKYATSLKLKASTNDPDTADLRWSPYEHVAGDPPLPIPVLNPNDSVYINGLSMTDVLFVRPEFNYAPFLTGIRFTATMPVPLDASLFATIHRPGSPSLYYATTVVGAAAYYMNVLAGGPIEQPLENTPAYASTAGVLELTYVAVPAVSDYGLVAMALLVLIMGTVVLKRRTLTGPT